MAISRNTALLVHFLLDECLPPIVRDSRWFMGLPFRLLFGRQASTFMAFKDRAHLLDDDEFRRVYEETASVHLERPTDLNAACTAEILRSARGSVLEVGCGRGHLAGLLVAGHPVTACDMVIRPDLRDRFPAVEFREENLGGLSFPDRSFDTVVCTHTLEHVLDLGAAIRELRRVARRRLLIVVPRQRPYRHTFDLHLHFFPLRCSLLAWLRPSPRTGTRDLRVLGGDWYY
ncbi:MAG: class I SAM-dependent methyltransferase, partial [Planctomycetaceae bacterium]